MRIFFIIIASLFLPLTRVFAHEEGATSVTFDNALGPIFAFVIIILAIVVAKRIKKIKKEKEVINSERRN